MAKKLILNLDFEHPFQAIGICSQQKDYRLCWLLNKQLEVELRRMRDFHYTPQHQKAAVDFPVYRYKNERQLIDFMLVSNKAGGQILFPEPKTLDYLFLLRNSSDQFDIAELLAKMRKTPYIQAAFFVGGKLGKQEKDFFFDFELFLSQKKK